MLPRLPALIFSATGLDLCSLQLPLDLRNTAWAADSLAVLDIKSPLVNNYCGFSLPADEDRTFCPHFRDEGEIRQMRPQMRPIDLSKKPGLIISTKRKHNL
jgi:hypothetical protein